ncbi:MAG: oxidoreductase, partial [Bradyrhizobium icense]
MFEIPLRGKCAERAVREKLMGRLEGKSVV